MARRTPKSLLACAVALALGGCGGGGDGTIPPDEADNLLNQLAALQDDVSRGDCDTAKQHAEEFKTGVNELPNDVDPDVASELTKAAANLEDLAADPSQCAGSGTTGESGVDATDTTEPDTTEAEPATTTTDTTTTEPDTTSEDTTDEPADETPPPESGNQGGDEGGDVSPAPGGNVTPTPSGGLQPPSGGVTPGGGGK
jgi:hypothetical protein